MINIYDHMSIHIKHNYRKHIYRHPICNSKMYQIFTVSIKKKASLFGCVFRFLSFIDWWHWSMIYVTYDIYWVGFGNPPLAALEYKGTLKCIEKLKNFLFFCTRGYTKNVYMFRKVVWLVFLTLLLQVYIAWYCLKLIVSLIIYICSVSKTLHP